MENLRLRYVITYVSSNPATSGPPRNIRVELIDPTMGKALKIRDSTGKIINASVFVQQTYSPGGDIRQLDEDFEKKYGPFKHLKSEFAIGKSKVSRMTRRMAI
jgi:hypothetical protein